MSISIENLNALQLDVLREIGNIGAGNAVTSLAKMLNRKVDMNIPKVQILEFKEIANLLGGADNTVTGILFSVSGGLDGYIMFVFEQKYAHTLVNMIMGTPEVEACDFNEMEISALKEVGNILAGSYLSALSTLTNLRIMPSVPYLTIDMAGAILSVPAIEFGKVGDSVLFIETEFSDCDYKILGNFFLIPSVGSYEVLLKSLGVIS
ncbi:MAG: chemotaxis protein CheC [Clostridiaceae bacterium]|nr:chemotaxis protein CheC [Clostridiaceae bacterium]